MKTDTHRQIGTTKFLIMTTVLLTLILLLMGCGEVVSEQHAESDHGIAADGTGIGSELQIQSQEIGRRCE